MESADIFSQLILVQLLSGMMFITCTVFQLDLVIKTEFLKPFSLKIKCILFEKKNSNLRIRILTSVCNTAFMYSIGQN